MMTNCPFQKSTNIDKSYVLIPIIDLCTSQYKHDIIHRIVQGLWNFESKQMVTGPQGRNRLVSKDAQMSGELAYETDTKRFEFFTS